MKKGESVYIPFIAKNIKEISRLDFFFHKLNHDKTRIINNHEKNLVIEGNDIVNLGLNSR